MKKLCILALAVFSLSAEENEVLNIVSFEKTEKEPSVLAPSEELAQKEIELFFEDDVMPSPAEEASSEIMAPLAIEPKDHFPEESISVQKQEIKLSDQSPAIAEKKRSSEEIAAPPAVKEETVLHDQELANLEAEVNAEKPPGITIDIGQVFSGSPIIYSTLLILSIGTFCLWLYSMFALRNSQVLPENTVKSLREMIENQQYEEALTLCKQQDSILFRMLATGLNTRQLGQQGMLDAMKAEGKRSATSLWQKIHLLNDVAIIAPMLGLLGTVLGMFYAFYDLNRSMESISALFDGLGVSVGTTVGGLVVAILAMLFYSMSKYRLVRQLTTVETEAEVLASMIVTKGDSL